MDKSDEELDLEKDAARQKNPYIGEFLRRIHVPTLLLTPTTPHATIISRNSLNH